MSLRGVRSLGRVLLWEAAHAAPRGYLIAAGLYLVADLALPASVRGWVVLPVLVASTALLVAHLAHEAMLCGICAAMTPLDGVAAAARHRRELRAHHLHALPIALIAAAVALPGTALVTGANISDLAWRLGVDAVTLLTAAYLHLLLVHRLLLPWCPRCGRWEDGGGHGTEPDPDPAPQPGRYPVSFALESPGPGRWPSAPRPAIARGRGSSHIPALEWR